LLLAIVELESQERSSQLDGFHQALMPLLREELAQTQRALERAAQGQYGICETCHRELGVRVLDLSPSTTVCPVCEARAQRGGVPSPA
jgi:RNA polymerase-binding transcription factor DksA